jgi:hypothetical protein
MRVLGSVRSLRNLGVLLSSFAVLALTSFGHVATTPQIHNMERMSGKQVASQSCQLICGGMYTERDKLLFKFEDNKLEPLPPLFIATVGYSAYSYILVLFFVFAYRNKVPIYRLNECLRM